ncbi:hypothetical protein JCM3770_006709 [Rhodotorula araucariae]
MPVSSTRAAPATSPARRATTSGLFSAAFAPATGGRTPRASRAAVVAPHTVAPGTRIRSAVTPVPGSAQLAAAQLVRTPAGVRARARMARGAAWRPSLTRGDVEAAQKLAERRELVRGPAIAALEELLMVGRDERAEENGDWRIGEAAETAVQAFKALKAAFLSSQDFLDVSSLAHVIPNELISPTSPINTLARLSNLITFLHLVLSSAPDDSGVAARGAVGNLKLASDAVMRYVKPEEDPVDDQLLKLLVDLKCQAYLLASSLSRTPIDTAPYFSQTLRQLLPSSRANAMTDRGAAAKFQMLQSAAVGDIDATNGDWAALRTKWRWEDVAREARDWVDRCVQESGLAASGAVSPTPSEDAELARQPVFGGEKSESEADNDDATVLRPENWKGVRAPELDEGDDEEDDEFESAQEGRGRDELEIVENAEEGGDTPDVEEMEVDQYIQEDGLATVFQGTANPVPSASSSSDDDDEIARKLTAGVSPTIMRSMPRHSQPRIAEHAAPFSGASALPAGVALAAQDSLADSQMTNRADSLLALGPVGHAELVVTEETLLVESQSDRADELFDFLPPAGGNTEGTPRARRQGAGADDAGSQAGFGGTVHQPAARGHLRFDGNNRLFVDKGSNKPQRSLLERQADARKISFDDSQSQPATPGVRVAQPHALSPEAGRVTYESLPSPEPTGGFPEDVGAEAGPLRLARQDVGREPVFYQGFDGGIDDGEGYSAETGELVDGRDAAAEVEGGAFTPFDEEDDADGLVAPNNVFGAKLRDKKGKGKKRAVVEEEEETLPTPPPPTIQDRLRAFRATQPGPGAIAGNFDTPSDSDNTTRRESTGESAKRASALRAKTSTLPSALAAGSASDDLSDDGESRSGESVDIVVPRRKEPAGPPKEGRRGEKKSDMNGKKRVAAEAVLSSDDELSTPEPPRQKKKGKARRVRSPSPPLLQGAARNNYFQGRNGPGLRVPWSTTETDLLIELLKRFDSDWKRMMRLHGPDGTVSGTFRHRTNVSLKDKAVNLAIGYLKRGEQLPKHFAHVTIPQSKLPKKAPEPVRANETDDESD